MKYLVIGLGNLGRAIAKDLTRVGNEVIGVDMDLHRVDMLKNDIAGAVALDSTDKEALSTLPLSEMDAIIVTFGKDFRSDRRFIEKSGCGQTDRAGDLLDP